MLSSICITFLVTLSAGPSGVIAVGNIVQCKDTAYYYSEDDDAGHKKGDRKYATPFQGPCVDTCTADGKCQVELEKPVPGLL
jgi:hypothetical protein